MRRLDKYIAHRSGVRQGSAEYFIHKARVRLEDLDGEVSIIALVSMVHAMDRSAREGIMRCSIRTGL